MSIGYIGIIVATLAIGLGATAYVKSQLKKYSNVPTANGLTGAETARHMLTYYGITDVTVRQGGADQDFYDPRSKSITLNPDVFNGRSVTAMATACHEVGHACQHAQSYVPMKIRTAIVPVVNLASNLWIFLLVAGMVLQIAQLYNAAIILYAFAVVFQVVTLPVEFNASGRAMTYMSSTGIVQGEQSGAFAVLRACALTYVAAALTSILQLLWMLAQRN